jgi:hypothetical protein
LKKEADMFFKSGKMVQTVAMAGTIWLMAPMSTSAVSGGELLQGSRIRVKVPKTTKHFYGSRVSESDWITGTLVRTTEQFIHLELASLPDTLAVRRDSLVAVESFRGVGSLQSPGRFFGTALGGAAGAVAGWTAVAFTGDRSDLDIGYGRPIAALLTGVLGAVLGGWGGYHFGGWLGGKIEYERWEEISGWRVTAFVPGNLNEGGRNAHAGLVLSF